MRRFFFLLLLAMMTVFLASCFARTDYFMRMPTVYSCSIGLVETHNDWKNAELRQGVDTIEMKRMGKVVDEEHKDNGDFTRTVFGNADQNIYFTVSYYEASLVVNDSHYVCSVIN